MLVAQQILRSSDSVRSALLSSHPFEYPSVAQIGGSDKEQLVAGVLCKSAEGCFIETKKHQQQCHITRMNSCAYAFVCVYSAVNTWVAQAREEMPFLVFPSLRAAAQLCEEAGFDAVNVNMGCPAQSAQHGAHGAVLMLDKNVSQQLARLLACLLACCCVSVRASGDVLTVPSFARHSRTVAGDAAVPARAARGARVRVDPGVGQVPDRGEQAGVVRGLPRLHLCVHRGNARSFFSLRFFQRI